MIHAVCLNPSLDLTVTVDGFREGAINRVTNARRDAGGKGINVARAAWALGAESQAWCILGGTTGDTMRVLLNEEGIPSWTYEAMGETRSNIKIVDARRGATTDVNLPGPKVDARQVDALLDDLLNAVRDSDVVVLAGSLPPGTDPALYARWVPELNDAGAQVFVDADGKALEAVCETRPALLKPNASELAQLLGREVSDLEQATEAAYELVREGIGRVVVSVGKQGAVMVDGTGAWQATAPKVEVASLVGTGDTMVAALAKAAEEDYNTEETLAYAVAAGTAAATTEGTQPPDRSLVEALAHRVDVEPTS